MIEIRKPLKNNEKWKIASFNEGIAYKIAKELKEVSYSQLRKVLDLSKKAVNIIKVGKANNNENFRNARDILFTALPITAYNAAKNSGSAEDVKKLFEFVQKYISEEYIQDEEDILMFDYLFTSIVAYHKYINNCNKEGK